MSKHIIEFTLQDAKEVKGDERLEWLYKVQDAIEELEYLDEAGIRNLNEIYGEDFVEKELERLYSIRDVLEIEQLVPFNINVTLKFSHGVDAETYEQAVEIVKSSFLEEYGITLQDDEIDPEELDLRLVLDLLEQNGYEDASNLLQLRLSAEADQE